MLEFKITGLGIDTRTDQPLVLLHNESMDSVLPIWIGRLEAQSIAVALQGEKLERPLSHDLYINTLESLNYKIQRVEIHTAQDGIFYADIVLKNTETGKTFSMDSRPSDAIAIAIRTEAEILVSEQVCKNSCIPSVVRQIDSEDQEKNISSDEEIYKEIKSEEEKENFLKFLDQVKASDFKLPPEKS